MIRSLTLTHAIAPLRSANAFAGTELMVRSLSLTHGVPSRAWLTASATMRAM
jgi:hypothetical protein